MESSRSRSMSRCGRTRSSSSNYLPDELILKILSWTCVISLLRCRSVCKSWLSIISKPEFIKAHLTNCLSKLPSILIFTSKIDDEDYIKEEGFELVERVYGRRAATIVYSNSPEEDSLNLPLMPPFDGNVEFISSCNGIVCVSVRDRMSVRDIYLFNPLTRRRVFTKLPPPPIFRIANHTQHCFTEDVVFGFDCLSHDFKVLKIAYATTADDHRKIMNVVAAHLYSLNDDSWRVIEVGIKLPSFLCYPYCPILRSGPVLDGVLYLEGMDVIITFNLHNESFGLLIKYPSFMHNTRKSSVLDFEASVALVIESVRDGTLDEKEVSLWTMEAVSDEVFWNKMLTFGAGSEEIDWVFLYCGADKFVGRTKLGTVVMYDYRKKETKIIGGLPSQSFLVRVLKHTENFLSPEEFKNVEGR